MRARLDENRLDLFIGDEHQGPYRAVLLSLAILTGYPGEASAILQARVHQRPTSTWWALADGFKDTLGVAAGETAEEEGWSRLFNSLLTPYVRAIIPHDQGCDAFIEWAPEVARFSFL